MAAEAGLEEGRVRTVRLAIDPVADEFDDPLRSGLAAATVRRLSSALGA